MEQSRPATQHDVERIAELAREMRGELGPMRGGALWREREARAEPFTDTYGELLDRDDALLLVATIDGVVLGFGAVVVEELRDGSRLGVITDLFVEHLAREVGLGDALAADLLEFCRAQGCIGVDAVALPGHRATKNFFEGHGFSARALTMHHSFAPDPSA
ncbi:MAG: GNAT family N-acetyltransferase [Acidimicrobiia bacterium]